MTPTEEPKELMWSGGQILAADIVVDREAAAALLPPGLSVAEESKATIFVADYPKTSFNVAYREAAVLLHVTDAGGRPAAHCPFMLVDDDASLIMGRELLGFPKKMGQIDFELSSDHLSASATRQDCELLQVEAHLGAPNPTPAPWSQRTINVVGSLITGMYFLELPAAAERVYDARHAEATITLGSGTHDPLARLSDPVTVAARFFVLDCGDAVADMPILGEGVDFGWAFDAYFPRAM